MSLVFCGDALKVKGWLPWSCLRAKRTESSPLNPSLTHYTLCMSDCKVHRLHHFSVILLHNFNCITLLPEFRRWRCLMTSCCCTCVVVFVCVQHQRLKLYTLPIKDTLEGREHFYFAWSLFMSLFSSRAVMRIQIKLLSQKETWSIFIVHDLKKGDLNLIENDRLWVIEIFHWLLYTLRIKDGAQDSFQGSIRNRKHRLNPNGFLMKKQSVTA